jgi:oligopeptide transport system permease protein
MLAILARRLLAGLAVIWLVNLITFAALRAMPGDPWADMAGEHSLPPAAAAHLRHLYGHDRPVLQQYLDQAGDALQGTFGYSLKIARGYPVAALVEQAAPVSLSLAATALALAVALGIGGGVAAAAAARRSGRRAQAIDRGLQMLATIATSVPVFVIAPLILIVFSLSWGWLPAGGMGSASALILPSLTLAVPLAAEIARLLRASLLDDLAADFTRTARAKGASEARILLEHALRPALGVVVAYGASAAVGLMTGSMVVEGLFALPGLGYYFIAGALEGDWPVVSAVAMLYAVLLVAANIVADLMQAWLDPRTRAAAGAP